MKKKILSSFALSLALCLTLGATACGDGGNKNNASMNNPAPSQPSGPVTPPVVDTYKGELSETSYVNRAAAQNAYLENEILGKATSVSSYYFQNQEMTEVELLDIKGDFIASGIITEEQISNVFKYLFCYMDSDTSEELQKIMYLLELTDLSYRYFTPEIEEGATLTGSYYDSVSKNTLSTGRVTVKTTMSMTMTTFGSIFGSEDTTQVINQSSTVYITPDAAYFKVTQKSSQDGQQMPEATADIYIVRSEEDPTKFIQAVKNEGYSEWELSYYPLTMEFPNIAPTDDQYLLCLLAASEFGLSDHSYFTKTSFGFTMNTAKEEKFMNDILSITTLSSFNTSMKDFLDSITLDFKDGSKSDFYVQNGAIGKYVYDISIDYYINGYENPYISQTMKGNNSYSNYGSTNVTVPQDVLEAIANASIIE